MTFLARPLENIPFRERDMLIRQEKLRKTRTCLLGEVGGNRNGVLQDSQCNLVDIDGTRLVIGPFGRPSSMASSSALTAHSPVRQMPYYHYPRVVSEATFPRYLCPRFVPLGLVQRCPISRG